MTTGTNFRARENIDEQKGGHQRSLPSVRYAQLPIFASRFTRTCSKNCSVVIHG